MHTLYGNWRKGNHIYVDTLYGNWKRGNHIYGDTFSGNWRRGNHIWNQKNKYNKPNVSINILDGGYFSTMKVLQL